ncbi:YXWGXW repeat-containing protein [Pontibacter sp. G13]|uniref:YXWGXW repeat-containing protein n=1 Tax=Pontibacter sp. G13 TaxID=3074898 RepID=UPI00288A44A2|nr:YXWGXW repeat-containing protein [Pontibacter sp. G13]WNJ16246.1 YXWGXW repeat-containing protein [Pontibacter sp. G13]
MSKHLAILALLYLSFATTAFSQVVVAEKPVPPNVVEKLQICDRNSNWIRGHWIWAERNNQYVWVKGRCVKARKGYIYQQGYWNKVSEGWVWVPGTWMKISNLTARRSSR